jgi:hypothetical protein
MMIGGTNLTEWTPALKIPGFLSNVPSRMAVSWVLSVRPLLHLASDLVGRQSASAMRKGPRHWALAGATAAGFVIEQLVSKPLASPQARSSRD